MNVPAIAKNTFDQLKGQREFVSIVDFIVGRLKKIPTPIRRARFLHDMIDEYNQEIFEHPLVQQLSPCKIGCSACCHTQVSVTDDEAELLLQKIHEGLEIDLNRLKIQMKAGDDAKAYFQINFEDRKCLFLSDDGVCRVYEDRPAVCRTNAVLGSPLQCDTSISMSPTRLVRTPKSDVAIYASYLFAKTAGSLPHMLGKLLKQKL